MLKVRYEYAVAQMEKGLVKHLPPEEAHHFAEIFAGNSLDGVHSHGMNRFPRYMEALKSGLCDARVTKAERVSGVGGLEVWDAHFGVGPLIAEQAAMRAVELAKEHGVACIALRNNSHWLRAGRYGLMMAEAGMAGICFTNTCQNLTAYGVKQACIGNNPVTLALPRRAGSLVLDMAVSQYAYGKLELMAQRGETLDTPEGYDTKGELTCDPEEICRSGLMLPMAKWKGSALSIMLDLMAATLSLGRTALQIGNTAAGERGMSQVYICINPAAVVDMDAADAQIEETVAYLAGIEPAEGGTGVHAPGQRLQQTRERHMREGIPVAEQTWERILKLAE